MWQLFGFLQNMFCILSIQEKSFSLLLTLLGQSQNTVNTNVMNLSDSNNMQENMTWADILNGVRFLGNWVNILTDIENEHL